MKRLFHVLGVGLKWLILALVVSEQKKSLDVMGARFLRVRQNLATTYDMLMAPLEDKPFLVNFRNALTDRTIPVYEDDGVHLKPQGNRMVAARMAEMLKDRGWLTAGGEVK